MISDNSQITVYGTTWCGGSRRVRLLLDKNQIPYSWIDIDRDEQAGKYVENLNRGNRSVPTLVWPDGSVLVEPSDEAMAKKLGIKLKG